MRRLSRPGLATARQGVSPLGLAVKEPDANSEDDIEATLAEVEILEARNEELCLSGLDIRCVPSCGCLDHFRGAIDRGQLAFVQPPADHRGGDPMTAADLEDAVVGTDAELIDDRLESLTHSAAASAAPAPRSVARGSLASRALRASSRRMRSS